MDKWKLILIFVSHKTIQVMANEIKVGSLVYFYDDETKHPYLVHDVFGKQVSLGLMEYPDVEQDDYVDMCDVILFNKSELRNAKKIIDDLLNWVMIVKQITLELVPRLIEPLFGIDGKARRRMRRKKLKNNHQ